MISLIVRGTVVLLWGLAGFSLFLAFYNRVMHRLRDSPAKMPLVAGLFLAVMSSAVGLGVRCAAWPWTTVPLVALAAMALGEMRRLAIRRRYRAPGPVGAVPHRIRLGRPVTTTDLVTQRYEIVLPAWKGPPFRLAHLSDFHVTRKLPLDYYRDVMSVAEEATPDLVLLTGDYIARTDCLDLLLEIMRPVGRTGTYAVLGNHDYWVDPERVISALWRSGITVLRNESRAVAIAGHSLCLTGYDYPWGTKSRHPPEPAGTGPCLVLSHTPDNVYRVQRAGAHALFAGHCHGGQMRAPVFGALVVPSVYGRRFDHGHFRVRGMHLFVAGGVGAATPPCRIYCPPDLFIVDVIGNEDSREAMAESTLESGQTRKAGQHGYAT